jgi:hypothetical protein
MPNAKVVFASFACAASLMVTNAVHSHEHNCGYVSWGVDEFELFGMTKSDISQQFKDKLTFDPDENRVSVDGWGHFLLTYRDKHVSEVQRQKRDPAGCDLRGPQLTSKEQALRFAIDGLSEITGLRPDEVKKLAIAKKMLLEIERNKTK